MDAYIHLDESVRHIAQQDDIARTIHIMKELFIYHPRALRIQQFMNFLFRSPERYRPTGLFICGQPGSGKTAQLRAYERAHSAWNAPDGGRRVPVLYLQMEEQPSPRSMYIEILNAAGVPWNMFPASMPARERVIRTLKALQTRMLAIDEIHNLCGDKRETTMVKWLRMLANHLRIPIVIAGTDRFLEVLEDLQMASRWPFVIELPLWTDSDEFQLLLGAWQRALPLRSASNLTTPAIRQAVLEETGGITDLIAKCLTYAAIAAIRLKRESITADLLGWWRDPPSLSGGDEDVDSWARAWLTDDRTRANPLKVYPLPAMRQVHRLTRSRIRQPA